VIEPRLQTLLKSLADAERAAEDRVRKAQAELEAVRAKRAAVLTTSNLLLEPAESESTVKASAPAQDYSAMTLRAAIVDCYRRFAKPPGLSREDVTGLLKANGFIASKSLRESVSMTITRLARSGTLVKTDAEDAVRFLPGAVSEKGGAP
jgi:hypothetical protein